MPSRDHTGTPGLEGFLHFHSSTTSGSAFLIRARSLESVLPRQSPSSSIFASISCDGDSSCGAELLVMLQTLSRRFRREVGRLACIGDGEDAAARSQHRADEQEEAEYRAAVGVAVEE